MRVTAPSPILLNRNLGSMGGGGLVTDPHPFGQRVDSLVLANTLVKKAQVLLTCAFFNQDYSKKADLHGLYLGCNVALKGMQIHNLKLHLSG